MAAYTLFKSGVVKAFFVFYNFCLCYQMTIFALLLCEYTKRWILQCIYLFGLIVAVQIPNLSFMYKIAWRC